jgi:hypothetical protein
VELQQKPIHHLQTVFRPPPLPLHCSKKCLNQNDNIDLLKSNDRTITRDSDQINLERINNSTTVISFLCKGCKRTSHLNSSRLDRPDQQIVPSLHASFLEWVVPLPLTMQPRVRHNGNARVIVNSRSDQQAILLQTSECLAGPSDKSKLGVHQPDSLGTHKKDGLHRHTHSTDFCPYRPKNSEKKQSSGHIVLQRDSQEELEPISPIKLSKKTLLESIHLKKYQNAQLLNMEQTRLLMNSFARPLSAAIDTFIVRLFRILPSITFTCII